MKNGSFEVSSVGTLLDFFALVVEKISEYTEFTLTESTELSATFDTHIDDIVLEVTDSQITSASSTNSSNALRLTFIRNSVTLTSYNIIYANNVLKVTDSNTRCINIIVHCTSDTNIYNINTYSNTTMDSNFMICKVKSQSILDNSESTGCFIYGNYYPSDSNSSKYIFRSTLNYSANGTVMINLMISSLSSSSSYDKYIPYMYNCSNITSNRYYLINNKKYFALTSNLLILEQE